MLRPLALCAVIASVLSVETGSAQQAAARIVEVKLANYRFEPSSLEFLAGEPVVLSLSNDTYETHNFKAPDFFASASVDPADEAKVVNGTVTVAAGKTETVRVVPASGRYRLVCTRPGHAFFGMKTDILVN